MCRFRCTDIWEDNSDNETEELPEVLAALLAIQLKADLAMAAIDNVVSVMVKTRTTLANFVTIHRNIKQHSRHLVKRVQRVTERIDNLETVDRWIRSTVVGHMQLKHVLDHIKELKALQKQSDSNWLKNQSIIKANVDKFNENFVKIMDYKKKAEELMTSRELFKITDTMMACRTLLDQCKDFGDHCYKSATDSNQIVCHICNQVCLLEKAFNHLISWSDNRPTIDA